MFPFLLSEESLWIIMAGFTRQVLRLISTFLLISSFISFYIYIIFLGLFPTVLAPNPLWGSIWVVSRCTPQGCWEGVRVCFFMSCRHHRQHSLIKVGWVGLNRTAEKTNPLGREETRTNKQRWAALSACIMYRCHAGAFCFTTLFLFFLDIFVVGFFVFFFFFWSPPHRFALKS